MEQAGKYPQPDRDQIAEALPAPGAALAVFEPPEGMHLAVTGQARAEERVRYGFRVGTLGLLVPVDAKSEVLAMPEVTALPRAPVGFLGLINLRGNLVPIYELHTLLRLEPGKNCTVPLALVFDQGDKAVGLAIDNYPVALAGLRQVSGAPVAPERLQEHVRGGYLQDDKIWLEFDRGAFFDEVSRGIRLETT